MASLEKFLKDQGYKFEQTENEVILEKSKKINIISIIVGVIGISIFVFLGIVFTTAASLMYIISFIILLTVARFNYRGMRPITIFDWTRKSMIRRSVYFFINSKSIPIIGYQGVDLRIKDLASTSTEGVDEFQKTVYLRTENGEINVVDFYTDYEPAEPEIPVIMKAIDDHLRKVN